MCIRDSDKDAASVVKALFLSRSREVLLEAWEVLQLAVLTLTLTTDPKP